MIRHARVVLGIALVAALLTACASHRIAIKESFGYAKRDQLVDRVEDARDEQEETKEQFATALDAFLSLNGTPSSELEAKFRQVDRQYEISRAKANLVSDRIEAVQDVAKALFREWRSELREYSSDSLRRASEQQLEYTEAQYERLIDMMKQAEASMWPVLDAFKDQTLFLKHNLNAQAIASLQGNVAELRGEVTDLIAEMERSIAEASAFIDQMTGEG